MESKGQGDQMREQLRSYVTGKDSHVSVSLYFLKLEKRIKLGFTSNAKQCISKFYIQILEENIYIVLSQNRVLETNLEHILLINNK